MLHAQAGMVACIALSNMLDDESRVLKLFVCEFITGGGCCRESGQQFMSKVSLLQEGAWMRDALLRDLSELPQLHISASYDYRLPAADYAHESVVIHAEDDPWQRWEQCIERADAVWPIAPETDGLLAKLSALVAAHNKLLIGSSHAAVQIAASKMATYQLMQQAGIPAVATYRYADAMFFHAAGAESNGQPAWVAKRDDGAGCEESAYFHDAHALQQWMQGREASHIIQPFQLGIAASISMLCNNGQAWLLSCNRQTIHLKQTGVNSPLVCDDTELRLKHSIHSIASSDTTGQRLESGEFQYAGSVINGMAHYWAEFSAIASRVAQALPGLAGYVGIDLMVEENTQGEPPSIHVLEINPRLTTSYAGLRAAMGYNPAKIILVCLNAGLSADEAGSAFSMPVLAREQVEFRLEAGIANDDRLMENLPNGSYPRGWPCHE